MTLDYGRWPKGNGTNPTSWGVAQGYDDYGRWPNRTQMALQTRALPWAMMNIAFGEKITGTTFGRRTYRRPRITHLANGHAHHSQGQRPWNTTPTTHIWPTAIVKLQPRCRIMPQSLSQLYAHLIFSTRDRFPFLKDDIRERVHG